MTRDTSLALCHDCVMIIDGYDVDPGDMDDLDEFESKTNFRVLE